MTARRHRHRFEPATMTWAEAAEYAFRRSESWLRGHIPAIPDFPRPDAVYNTFSKAQVDAWLARRYGLECPPGEKRDFEAELLERARGKNQGPIPGRKTA
jgi:hypothetical protein